MDTCRERVCEGCSEPPGQQHQHQLGFLSDSLADLRVFESTAGAAIRPNDWPDFAKRGASIISISWASFQIPSPISGCSNPQQAPQFDRMIGRI